MNNALKTLLTVTLAVVAATSFAASKGEGGGKGETARERNVERDRTIEREGYGGGKKAEAGQTKEAVKSYAEILKALADPNTR